MTGASEIFELAADFGKASSQVAGALYDVYAEQGQEFVKDWGDNVRQVAPEHLPHLPDAITSETRISTDIHVVTGPEAGRRQGKLGRGDEFGSENQPPHLSGLHAMTAREPLLERAADATIAFLLP